MIGPAHGVKMAEAGHEKDCTQSGCHFVTVKVFDNAVDKKSNHCVGNPAQEVEQNQGISQHLVNQKE
jgi:hypothetical protein